MDLTKQQTEQAVMDLERIQKDNPGALLWITKEIDGKQITENFSLETLKTDQEKWEK